MDQTPLFLSVYVFGLAVGVLCAFGITIVWMMFASTLLEGLWELFGGRGTDSQPATLQEAMAISDAKAVIISDLHVDRWDEHDTNIQSLRVLAQLLKENSHIRECIINGDFADFPEEALSSVLQRPIGMPDLHGSKSVEMISHCIGILSETNITLSIVLGNHDLSLHGLRNPHTNSAILPGNLKQIWDGVLLLNMKQEEKVLVEHGHRYDPLLTLYTSYRMLDIARNTQFDQASDFYKHLAGSSHTRAKKVTAFSRLREGIIKLRYRGAARFNHRGAKAVTYGHTHLPDRFVFPSGCVYVNTGSWESNRGGYVAVVTDKGNLWGPYSV